MHEAGLPHEGISRAAAELERRRAVSPRTVMSDFEGFFAPYERAVEDLKAQDLSAIPTALAFLEADPECFRSGYMKADLMHALANGPDLSRHRARVQGLVVLRECRPSCSRLHGPAFPPFHSRAQSPVPSTEDLHRVAPDAPAERDPIEA